MSHAACVFVYKHVRAFVCALLKMRALLRVFTDRGTADRQGMFPEMCCLEGKRGLLCKALFFSCFYAPNGRCLITLKPLSKHGCG